MRFNSSVEFNNQTTNNINYSNLSLCELHMEWHNLFFEQFLHEDVYQRSRLRFNSSVEFNDQTTNNINYSNLNLCELHMEWHNLFFE